MNNYEYDPDLPYVLEVSGFMLARTKQPQHARYLASAYVKSAKVIDTTPKPRVPDDAEHVVWIYAGTPNYRMYAEKSNGLWLYEDALDGSSLEDLPGVTADTVFTVLEERKSDD